MRAKTMIASLLLLFTLGQNLPVHASDERPVTSAASAVLYEANSGSFLYTKDAYTRRPMASTTKIMTALVALEHADLTERVTIPADAVGIEGSSLYLQIGETLTLEQLLYGLLLQSANDAATAIALTVAGSVDGFSALMNEKAAELGLADTHFTNPHGLHNDEHYTTAHDLACIAAAAMENDIFRTIASTKKYTIPATERSETRVLVNHNKLLSLDGACVGIKTGFTKKSGRCLVGAAEKNGVRLITVTLNAPSDWNDHRALFSYGFSQMETRTLAAVGELRYTISVVNGECDRVLCVNREEISVVLPKSAPAPTVNVKLPHFTAAPVKEGEVLGTVEYLLDGRVIASASLCAAASIPEILYRKGLF